MNPTRGPQLVIQLEDIERKRRARFVIDRSPVHLGRSELNDLVLPMQIVSLWHGVIKFDDGSIRYVDTSRNGTVVDGVLLKTNQSVELKPKQKLTIGPLHLLVSMEPRVEGASEKNVAQREQMFGEASDVEVNTNTTLFFKALQTKPVKEKARTPTPAGVVVFDRAALRTQSTDATFVERPVEGTVRTQLGPLDEAVAGLYAAIDKVQITLASQLAGKSEAEKREAQSQWAVKYPKLTGVNLVGGAGPSSEGGLAHRMLNQFASSYVARRGRLDNEAQIERFLDRVAQVLETFAKGFIELRRGYESSGEQLGVVSRRASRLAGMDSIPKVLEYLLDETQSDARVAELTKGFAEAMIHQVALVGGIREGVREVVGLVGPERVERNAERRKSNLLERLVPAHKLWATFLEEHRDLLEDEQRLTQALFGRAFVRAYALVASGGHDDDRTED